MVDENEEKIRAILSRAMASLIKEHQTAFGCIFDCPVKSFIKRF
jgi:hypothetical protein